MLELRAAHKQKREQLNKRNRAPYIIVNAAHLTRQCSKARVALFGDRVAFLRIPDSKANATIVSKDLVELLRSKDVKFDEI